MFTEQKMTERIKKVKTIYEKCPVQTEKRPFFYSGDRWISLGFLEGWLKNQKTVTTKLRRSLAEAYELDSAEPIIDDHELIVGKPWFPAYTEEENARFSTLLESFKMSPSGKETESYRARADHICLDYEKLLRVGVQGLIEEIKEKKRALDFSAAKGLYDFDTVEKNEFYDCAIIELEAVLRLADRYAAHARSLAEAAAEPRKADLLKIAENLERVPRHPAKTFYEAVQSIHFYTFNMFGLYPLGRPDRYLLPYYESDIESGALDKPFAQELIDNLCLGVSAYTFSRAASGFIVGGTDAHGDLVENDLTYMFLTALRHIKMPDPNGALAVCEKTSDEILSYAIDILGEGTTHPAIYNDTAIIEGLIKYGVPKRDAVNYIHTTCAEISVCGKSRMYTTSQMFNLPKELLRLLERAEPASFEALVDAYFERLRKKIGAENKEYALRILEAARNSQQPIRAACLVDDCIERGKDVYAGGAKYSFMQPIFIGFANLCDSLIAIKELVFTQRRLTLAEFLSIVQSDFKDSEPLRGYIINKLPHYGNDDEKTDTFAHALMQRLALLFGEKALPFARFSMPGTFSYVSHASLGSDTGATFDGRRSGRSLSDGCCPAQGMDVNGPTALINSLTGWDQTAFLGGMVINLKFAKSLFSNAKKQIFLGIIKVFIARGGIEMQINCVDRKTLEDARIHPEEHRNLIVRVGGYSDHFVKLSPTLQREIIERTEY